MLAEGLSESGEDVQMSYRCPLSPGANQRRGETRPFRGVRSEEIHSCVPRAPAKITRGQTGSLPRGWTLGN